MFTLKGYQVKIMEELWEQARVVVGLEEEDREGKPSLFLP